MANEADTCHKQVVPKRQVAGWDDEPRSIAEQRMITDGRVIPVGKGFVRKPPKRVGYLLRYEITLLPPEWQDQVVALSAIAQQMERLQSDSAELLALLLPSVLTHALKSNAPDGNRR